VLFTVIDRKSRSNRVRKITNPVELALPQLRIAPVEQSSGNQWPFRKIKNLLELRFLYPMNLAHHRHRQKE
jgi:hypothetical protein